MIMFVCAYSAIRFSRWRMNQSDTTKWAELLTNSRCAPIHKVYILSARVNVCKFIHWIRSFTVDYIYPNCVTHLICVVEYKIITNVVRFALCDVFKIYLWTTGKEIDGIMQVT